MPKYAKKIQVLFSAEQFRDLEILYRYFSIKRAALAEAAEIKAGHPITCTAPAQHRQWRILIRDLEFKAIKNKISVLWLKARKQKESTPKG